MTIWAIADLHLCLGVPEKTMEVFGPAWHDYIQRLQLHWQDQIQSKDLVLLAGDISWAMRLEQAAKDFAWIDQLPGTKVMIKGNHDYWCSSAAKVRASLPASIHFISNDAFEWEGISIAGTRLWDTSECRFNSSQVEDAEQEKIYDRELGRLETSLKAMKGSIRLAMTHYPPIGFDLKPTRASQLLNKYGVYHCVFGHLHALDTKQSYFGVCEGITYHLTAADYLNFVPKKIL